jgi:hypothetical protein
MPGPLTPQGHDPAAHHGTPISRSRRNTRYERARPRMCAGRRVPSSGRTRWTLGLGRRNRSSSQGNPLARQSAPGKGIRNVDFEQTKIDGFYSPAQFDAVVGRYILVHPNDQPGPRAPHDQAHGQAMPQDNTWGCDAQRFNLRSDRRHPAVSYSSYTLSSCRPWQIDRKFDRRRWCMFHQYLPRCCLDM